MARRLKSLIEDDLIRDGDVLVVFGDDEEGYSIKRVVGVVTQLDRPYQVILETLQEDGSTNRTTTLVTKVRSLRCEVLDNMDDEEWSDFCRVSWFANLHFEAVSLVVEEVMDGEPTSEDGVSQTSIFSPAPVGK